MRRFSALIAAALFAFVAVAPAFADARDRRGPSGYDRQYYGRHYDYRRHHRDRDDALAAGAVGLILGLALGAALSDRPPPPPRVVCAENYRRCPPPAYYGQAQPYYGPGAYQGGYQDDYDGPYEDDYDARSAYEQDYGRAPPPPQGYGQYAAPPAPACTRIERQWDRYANRYVNVPVPC